MDFSFAQTGAEHDAPILFQLIPTLTPSAEGRSFKEIPGETGQIQPYPPAAPGVRRVCLSTPPAARRCGATPFSIEFPPPILHNPSMPNTTTPSRRDFLKSSAIAAAAASAATMAIPSAVRAAGTDVIKVGLIGCGGRGSGAAIQAMSADPGVRLSAIADLFPDHIQLHLASLKKQKPEQCTVTQETQFLGLDAYKQLLASDVDAVILTTPPAFRSIHLKAAIAAGKHVFCEKPIAVDAPGVRSVLETAEEAKKKNLAIVSGFCWRYSYPEMATFEQIHNGRIGEILAHHGTYNTNALWMFPRKPEWSDTEWQLRNWLYFTWLSGDHIVEQAIHTIDKICWSMKDNVAGVKCVGTGGRQVRIDPAYGQIYDHFAVTYEWPNGTRGFLHCRQQENCAADVSDRIYGTKGVANVLGTPGHNITGENPWKYEGENPNMYQVEHNELFKSIRAGKPINNGVRMATSTMMGILGRMAAYTGQVITYEQAFNSKESLVPESLDLKAPMPVAPVAMPGKTKFI
jgi:myo-inositol 2-dehydrogenase/D-chiro-inositol 1-dehydrogenase